jgi:hypothetical protein
MGLHTPPPSLRVWASQVISQFVRRNRGFLAFGASLLGAGPGFAGLSLLRKFPFPAQAETGSMTGGGSSV